MPEAAIKPVLYAGPSTHGVDPSLLDADRVQLRPPVRRDDLRRLVDAAPAAGTVIICDGVFQSAAAVSHAELCLALDAGWQVWGVSSLGAIRAHEMRADGMHGFGEVFAMFDRFEDFTDDELCLLYFPEPPWFPVTEALVNLRHALAVQGPMLGIGDAAGHAVVQSLRGLWFGDRTTQCIYALLCGAGGCSAAQAEALLSWLASHRLKSLDLQAMLVQRPWAAAPGRTP